MPPGRWDPFPAPGDDPWQAWEWRQGGRPLHGHVAGPADLDQARPGRGQVGNVVFAEGLVAFKGQWWLYTGLADSRLGVSTAPIG